MIVLNSQEIADRFLDILSDDSLFVEHEGIRKALYVLECLCRQDITRPSYKLFKDSFSVVVYCTPELYSQIEKVQSSGMEDLDMVVLFRLYKQLKGMFQLEKEN